MEREVLNCQKCKDLYMCRKTSVPGMGAGQAKVIFLGYIPDINDSEEQGKPFSGKRISDFLNFLMDEIQLDSQEEVYFTYVLKCVPKKCEHKDRSKEKSSIIRLLRRDNSCELTMQPCTGQMTSPSENELSSCFEYLSKEISIITPHVIIPFGLKATKFVLSNFLSRKTTSNKMQDYHMKVYKSPSFKVLPMQSLSWGLRQRKAYIKDFRNLGKFIRFA
jgi:DNA polymerase